MYFINTESTIMINWAVGNRSHNAHEARYETTWSALSAHLHHQAQEEGKKVSQDGSC